MPAEDSLVMAALHQERPYDQYQVGATYVQEASGWAYQIREDPPE